MAGTASGLLIIELFGEAPSFRNDWLFATADLEFVSVGVLEEEGVIAGAVTGTQLWSFQIFAADLADELGDAVHFFTRLRPESDSCAVGLMMSIFGETKEFRRLVGTDRVKRSPVGVGPIAGKSKLRQKFAVKLKSGVEVFNSQINMIKMSRFHFVVVDLSLRRITNFRPDQTSSTAPTFMSTNPSGNATARITSSVMSVLMPDDFFGHETHNVPASAILDRSRWSCLFNSLRCFVKKWMKLEFVVTRLLNFASFANLPSKLR